MGLAIFATFAWPIFGIAINAVFFFAGIFSAAFALDATTHQASVTWGKKTLGVAALGLLWTVLWLTMTAISISNWIAAAS